MLFLILLIFVSFLHKQIYKICWLLESKVSTRSRLHPPEIFFSLTTETKRMEDDERRWYRPKCGGRPYNPAFYLCCDGNRVSRTGLRPACCGRYSYDAAFYLCCDGSRVSKTGLRPACCGRYSYDAAFYLCCDGNRESKTGLRPACCGKHSYDAAFYLCCNGRLKSKSGFRPSC